MDTFTDAVFFNGLITTLDRMRPQAEAMAMLRDQAQRTTTPQWVRVVGGLSEFQFAEKRLPTLAECRSSHGLLRRPVRPIATHSPLAVRRRCTIGDRSGRHSATGAPTDTGTAS